jgi:hypothetical protein
MLQVADIFSVYKLQMPLSRKISLACLMGVRNLLPLLLSL